MELKATERTESPIPLGKTESRKNIWPFHASRVITRTFHVHAKKGRSLFRMWRWEGVKLQKFDASVAHHVCKDHGRQKMDDTLFSLN